MTGDASALLMNLALLIGFLLILFLLLREVTCWYFKINKMTKRLDEVLAALDKGNSQREDVAKLLVRLVREQMTTNTHLAALVAAAPVSPEQPEAAIAASEE